MVEKSASTKYTKKYFNFYGFLRDDFYLFLNRLKRDLYGVYRMSEFYPEVELDSDKSYVLTPEQKERYMESKIKAKEKSKK